MKNINIVTLLSKKSVLWILTTFFSPFAVSEITLDGSMGAAGALSGPDYQITENLGQRAGNNLFHSFGQFNLNKTESATFSGSTGIQNVISRVTGGQASTIDGAFISTIPGANIYFLNPSGVIFGENASLDVQGSFHASTADYLKFKNGGRFKTGLATANPILITASPEAFGFLNDAPASISLSGGQNKLLQVPNGETLSLSGGDISIENRSLYAPGGQVVLASAGSTGEIIFNESGIDTSSFTKGGDIHLSRASTNPVVTLGNDQQIADIDASADAAGKVVIRGGQMVMDNAYIWADTTNGKGGDIDIALIGGLTIKGVPESSEVETTPQSGITADTQGKGDAGNIQLTVDNLKLTHGSRIDSTTTSSSSGNGGDLTINANSILLEGNDSDMIPSLRTGTQGEGHAGNINIVVEGKLDVHGGANIRSYTTATGNTGAITLKADLLNVSDRSNIYTFIAESATGNSGDLSITTDNLKIDHADITTFIYGSGTGGNLAINTVSLELLGGIIGFKSNSKVTSQIGNINIIANTILLEGDSFSTRAEISVYLFGNGTMTTGNLTVQTEKLEINNWAGIRMNNFGTGNTGDLFVEANEIVITNAAGGLANGIVSTLASTGNLGDLTIKSQNLIIRDGGNIGIKNHGSGSSGELFVKVENDIILDGTSLTSGSSISNSATSSGQIKNTFISARNILLNDNAFINTSTSGLSNAGDLFIQSDRLEVRENSLIASGANFPGDSSQKLGQSGDINIDVNHLGMSGSFITSFTNSIGDAGDITITANKFEIKNGSGINTNTQGIGRGGDLTISADKILLNNSVLVTGSTFAGFDSNSEPDVARAGDLTITSNGSIRLENNSVIATKTDQANAGFLKIGGNANLQLHDESRILTLVDDGEGKGGDIIIDNPIVVLDDSFINANAVEGAGGNISISGFLFQSPMSFVTARSKLSADGQLNLKPETNISGNLAVLSNSLLNAEEYLSDTCTARSEKNHNSFIVKSSGSIPLSPGELMPANFLIIDNNITRKGANKKDNSPAAPMNNNQLSFIQIPCVQ